MKQCSRVVALVLTLSRLVNLRVFPFHEHRNPQRSFISGRLPGARHG